MAIQFDFYPSPHATNEEPHYHPRVVTRAPLESEEILAQINHRCSLTESDVIACLTELGNILNEGLSKGRTVHLAGIGYFSLSLRCTDTVATPKTRAEHVAYKGVNYRPDKRLKRKLSTLKLERAEQKKHSAILTDQEVNNRVEMHFAAHATLTRSQLEKLCSFTRGKALRHINRLVSEGKLENVSSRYQAIYVKRG